MLNIDWLKRRLRDFDFVMLIILLVISTFSILAVYSSTINRSGMEEWYTKEVIWQVISYFFMFVFVVTDYKIFTKKIPWIGYAISLFLLIIVFAFPTSHGAHSWITLPGFQFQPSEFAKIFVIMTIADYMTKAKENEETFGWKHFGVIVLIVMVPLVLILKQPALGQAMVLIGITFSMMFMFLEKRQLILLSIFGGLFLSAVILLTGVFPDQTLKMIEKTPLAEHQKERIITFFNPEADPTGIGFQVIQAKTAVGSGGLFGQGLFNGYQTQGAWVPEQWTDFIFSAISEEFGFLGSSTLVLLFCILLYRMIRIAATTDEDFAAFFIVGATGMFGFQVFENIGMNLSIMPVAGITLPFVSYGGSSLLTNFIVVGIILSIAIRRRKLIF